MGGSKATVASCGLGYHVRVRRRSPLLGLLVFVALTLLWVLFLAVIDGVEVSHGG